MQTCTTASSPNPFGGRLRTAIHRQAETASQNYAGLPRHTNRFTVVKLLRQIGREIGWTGRLVDHLELLIAHTREEDWREDSCPVVWLSVRETALRLNICQRQVRRNENALMRLGAIAFSDSSNCRRFGWRDEDGLIVEAYGIDLSPCAALIARLAIALDHVTANREKYLRLRRQISAIQRRIRATLAASLGVASRGREEVGEMIEKEMADLARASAIHDGCPLVALETHIARLIDIDRRLTALLDGDQTPPENRENNNQNVCQDGQKCPPRETKMSARADSHVRPTRIQNKDDKYKPDKASQTRKPQHSEPTPEKLLARMPEPVATGLPVNQPAGWPEIIEAARLACHPLGISQDAWGQACRVLGRRGAALALIVIASRRERIASPGGYLRAMTGRAEDGRLNLQSSISKLLN